MNYESPEDLKFRYFSLFQEWFQTNRKIYGWDNVVYRFSCSRYERTIETIT